MRVAVGVRAASAKQMASKDSIRSTGKTSTYMNQEAREEVSNGGVVR